MKDADCPHLSLAVDQLLTLRCHQPPSTVWPKFLLYPWGKERYPVLLFLGVSVSLVFLLPRNSLVFLSGFCLFSGYFKGSQGETFVGVFEVSLVFSKRPRKKRTGYIHHKHCYEFIRRVESTLDPDTFEKYCYTPPISIAILLQKYALLSAESSVHIANLYHDTPPICIAILLQKY